ncbi:MAG: hypothetical protein RL266_1798 [Bacteroidota bacterium]|jgi:hypothetical protein
MKWLLVALILPICSVGQNLVPNSSFEDGYDCPFNISQFFVNDWFNPSLETTPDYYHACSNYPIVGIPQNICGYEFPRAGDGYIGLVLGSRTQGDYREYACIELDAQLESGTEYEVSFFLSLADSSNFSVNSLGVQLSSSVPVQIFAHEIPLNNPLFNSDTSIYHNKVGWSEFRVSYLALGGESYLSIGNFSEFNQTVFFPTSFGGDTTSSNNFSYAYYYIDEVSVTRKRELGIAMADANSEVGIYPNPVSDMMLVMGLPTGSDVTIVNGVGSMVLTVKSETKTFSIETSNLPDGIYFLVTETGSFKFSIIR